jgi:hypothetical protein
LRVTLQIADAARPLQDPDQELVGSDPLSVPLLDEPAAEQRELLAVVDDLRDEVATLEERPGGAPFAVRQYFCSITGTGF